jgi:hypothetical protein
MLGADDEGVLDGATDKKQKHRRNESKLDE